MYYCGIDVAKRGHVVSVIDDTGKVLNHGVPISNDRIGFQQLVVSQTSIRG